MVRIGNYSLSRYKIAAILVDLVMVYVALYLALQNRFDFSIVPAQYHKFKVPPFEKRFISC